MCTIASHSKPFNINGTIPCQSYDQPRQNIKKQRHYFANKGLSSQGCGFSSIVVVVVQSLSRVRLSVTPWITARQASLSITSSRSSLRFMSVESVMPSSHLISSHPLSSASSPPGPNPSQHQSLFQWVNSSHEVARVLEFQLYHHSFQRNPRADLQNGLVGSPCSPRNSQESSPISQFKSINSSVLSFLHSPTLTSIHDYWKNHSLD